LNAFAAIGAGNHHAGAFDVDRKALPQNGQSNRISVPDASSGSKISSVTNTSADMTDNHRLFTCE
jgi:hypothetical protein